MKSIKDSLSGRRSSLEFLGPKTWVSTGKLFVAALICSIPALIPVAWFELLLVTSESPAGVLVFSSYFLPGSILMVLGLIILGIFRSRVPKPNSVKNTNLGLGIVPYVLGALWTAFWTPLLVGFLVGEGITAKLFAVTIFSGLALGIGLYIRIHRQLSKVWEVFIGENRELAKQEKAAKDLEALRDLARPMIDMMRERVQGGEVIWRVDGFTRQGAKMTLNAYPISLLDGLGENKNVSVWHNGEDIHDGCGVILSSNKSVVEVFPFEYFSTIFQAKLSFVDELLVMKE